MIILRRSFILLVSFILILHCHPHSDRWNVGLQSAEAFTVVPTPSASPLQYVTPAVIGELALRSLQKSILDAILPNSDVDALAIFISEGASGFLGGAAAQGIALIDKNKRTSGLLNAKQAGAYFGVAGAVNSLASLFGLSSILVNVLGLSFGFTAGELFKLRRRSIEPMRTRVGDGPTMYDLMRFERPRMQELMRFQRQVGQLQNRPWAAFGADYIGGGSPLESGGNLGTLQRVTSREIAADLTKWFLLYNCAPLVNQVEQYVVVGVVAGILSQLVREEQDRREAEDLRQKRRDAVQKLRAQRKLITVRPGKSISQWVAEGDSRSQALMKSMSTVMTQQRRENEAAPRPASSRESTSNNIFDAIDEALNAVDVSPDASSATRRSPLQLPVPPKSESPFERLLRFTEDTAMVSAATLRTILISFRQAAAKKQKERTAAGVRSVSAVRTRIKNVQQPVVKVTRRPRMQLPDDEDQPDLLVTRFARAALETAAQLITYEYSRRYAMELSQYLEQGNALDDFSLILTNSNADGSIWLPSLIDIHDASQMIATLLPH